MFSRFLPFSMSEQDRDPPRWIPYSAPPANAWDRTHDFFRGLLFPVTIVLFGLGVWGGLYWLSQPQEEPVSTNVQVSSPIESSATTVGDSSGTAALTVQSQPEGASVWINGDSVDTTPLRGHTLEPGVYFLSVRSQGYLNADTVVTLSNGGAPELTVSLDARPRVGSEPASTGGGTEQVSEADGQNAQLPTSSSSDDTEPQEESSSSVSPEPSSTEAAVSEPASDEGSQGLPTGSLRITSEPRGAEVLINGNRRGQTPLTLNAVLEGSHDVTLQREGYAPWSASVSTEANTTQNVHGTLEPLRGQLRVLARPWGTIYIDDSLHARESDIWYETELPVGQHQVRVVHPSLGEQSRTVDLEANEENEIVINLRGDDSETQR